MGYRSLTCLLLMLLGTTLHGDEPLHVQIDQQIVAAAKDTPIQAPAGDAEFLRRVYLDFAGRIPTTDEAKAFLDDRSDQKREKLIDQLLDAPEYPRRMAELFHVMLMERRGENEEWTKFLQHAFTQNTPWDEIARAIVKPPADEETRRGAAYFMTARLVKEGAMAAVDVPALTRDVGRMLAGIDLQCAECHDHLNIEDYKQRDFQGLHVVFENVQTRGDAGFPAITEKIMKQKKEYASVFVQQQEQTGPVVPGGKEIEIVVYEGDEAYLVAPDKKKRTPGQPKFSPLTELATGLASKDNELFCKNIANRLWFVMMGRGLVEPLDLQHTVNPPSHPELLDLLAKQFAEHDFDIKWMLRELAMTQTYQRTSVLPAGEAPAAETYAVALERRISAEQLFRNVLVATGELEAQGKHWNLPPAEIDQFVSESEELKALEATFIKVFANPPKEAEIEIAPTVKAALFLMHEKALLKVLQPRAGNLTGRVAQAQSDQVADALFLAILSRQPTAEDREDVKQFLANHPDDKPTAITQLAWALLASTEFCVNH